MIPKISLTYVVNCGVKSFHRNKTQQSDEDELLIKIIGTYCVPMASGAELIPRGSQQPLLAIGTCAFLASAPATTSAPPITNIHESIITVR